MVFMSQNLNIIRLMDLIKLVFKIHFHQSLQYSRKIFISKYLKKWLTLSTMKQEWMTRLLAHYKYTYRHNNSCLNWSEPASAWSQFVIYGLCGTKEVPDRNLSRYRQRKTQMIIFSLTMKNQLRSFEISN